MSSRFDVDSSSDSEAEQDGFSDSNQLPTEPPFMAYLQNLKPEVAEADVRSFFHELEVVAIDLGAKGKGEGQVEFKDRETLVRALFYSGRLLLGLEVKVEAKPKGAAAAASASKGKGNNNGGAGAAAKAREGASAQGAAEGGGRGGGGFRGGRGGERGRGRGDGRGPRSSIFGSSRGDRGGGFRPRRNSDVGEDGADGGSGGGEGAEGNPAERKERPKLQLKPRSKPLEAKEAAAEAARKPSIFGGGKPHDELEWTKKWQEHHKEDPEEQKSYSIRGDRTKARSGSFSGEPDGRPRSGSMGREGAAGGGGGAGGRGGRGGGGVGSKKPGKPKPVVGEDGWCEVDPGAAGDKAPKRAVDVEMKEDETNRAVGGAFAALNLLGDSDEGESD